MRYVSHSVWKSMPKCLLFFQEFWEVQKQWNLQQYAANGKAINVQKKPVKNPFLNVPKKRPKSSFDNNAKYRVINCKLIWRKVDLEDNKHKQIHHFVTLMHHKSFAQDFYLNWVKLKIDSFDRALGNVLCQSGAGTSIIWRCLALRVAAMHSQIYDRKINRSHLQSLLHFQAEDFSDFLCFS